MKLLGYFVILLICSPVSAGDMRIIRAVLLSKTRISLEFNLPVDATAENIENYSISHGAKVLSALANDSFVILDTTEIRSGVSYIVTDIPSQSQYFFSRGMPPRILQEPPSRLPNFSFAGYHAGDVPVPDIPIVANILDFGAVADDDLDDSQAFANAIDQTESGAIFVPAGRYMFDDILLMDKSGIILRGEGPDTILEFRVSLYDIYPDGNWQYNRGGMVWIGQPNGEDGIGEMLSFVNDPSVLGDTFLYSTDTSQIQVGEYLLLIMEDDAFGSMYSHIQEGGPVGNCGWQPLPLWHPVRVVGIDPDVVEIDHPLPFDVRLEWNPQIARYAAIEEIGLENLKIQLPARLMNGPHFGDGYNGIHLSWALNSWVRNVVLENCDACLSFGAGTSFSTAKNIDLLFGMLEGVRFSHHGFSFGRSSNNLLTDFFIEMSIFHDISMTHLAHQNVVRNGIGKNINFDHHRDAPFSNLFTDIDVGDGTRLYQSSGSGCAGPHTGARETFWNIKSTEWIYTPAPVDYFLGLQVNVVPAQIEWMEANGPWYEMVQYPSPSDLYLEQLQVRLGTLPEGFGVLPPIRSKFYASNRYLSFYTPESELPVALRIAVLESDIAIVGSQSWVGPVQNGRAFLGCFRYYDTWDEHVIVTGADIVPSSSYRVESTVDGEVFQTVELISTNKWGDVAGRLEFGSWTEANDLVDIMDMLAGIACFVNNPGAPSIDQCDLFPEIPDFRIDILDILMIINGFANNPYPFDVAAECH